MVQFRMLNVAVPAILLGAFLARAGGGAEPQDGGEGVLEVQVLRIVDESGEPVAELGARDGGGYLRFLRRTYQEGPGERPTHDAAFIGYDAFGPRISITDIMGVERFRASAMGTPGTAGLLMWDQSGMKRVQLEADSHGEKVLRAYDANGEEYGQY